MLINKSQTVNYTPLCEEHSLSEKKNEWNTVVFTKQNLNFLPFSNNYYYIISKMSPESRMIRFILKLQDRKNSGWHFELNFSHNCKENSGKKLQNVTISSDV